MNIDMKLIDNFEVDREHPTVKKSHYENLHLIMGVEIGAVMIGCHQRT